MALEENVGLISRCKENSERAFYKYCVDVGSGWIYYTLTYALQELASGKDTESVIKTRAIGLLAHAVVMRPVGMLRNYVAERWKVTDESSIADKIKVNLVTVTPPQAITYGAMLMGGMAWSGHYDWKSSAIAWGVGVALGTLHSAPYGWFQDKFRKAFGVQPAIKEVSIEDSIDKEIKDQANTDLPTKPL